MQSKKHHVLNASCTCAKDLLWKDVYDVIAATRKEAMKTEPFLSRTPVYRKYTGDLVPLWYRSQAIAKRIKQHKAEMDTNFRLKKRMILNWSENVTLSGLL